MAIIKGTKENFEAEVLNANGVVVVDFGANWCGPCKSLVPILDEVVEEDPSKKIVKVDIDEQEELATQYKIMSVPTLLVFKDGQLQETLTNSSDISLNDLKEFFKSHK